MVDIFHTLGELSAKHPNIVRSEATKMAFCWAFWLICTLLYMGLYSFGDHGRYFEFFKTLESFITDASSVLLLCFQFTVLFLMSTLIKKVLPKGILSGAVSEEAWKLAYTVSYAMTTHLLIERHYLFYILASIGITIVILPIYLTLHDFQSRHSESQA